MPEFWLQHLAPSSWQSCTSVKALCQAFHGNTIFCWTVPLLPPPLFFRFVSQWLLAVTKIKVRPQVNLEVFLLHKLKLSLAMLCTDNSCHLSFNLDGPAHECSIPPASALKFKVSGQIL
jgi:hypothetical protein